MSFQDDHDYLKELKPDEYVEDKGLKHPKYNGLVRLANIYKEGIKSQYLNVKTYPSANNNNESVIEVTYRFGNGQEFSEIGHASNDNLDENADIPVRDYSMAMACTRGKVRALRDAFHITVAAWEEISEDKKAASDSQKIAIKAGMSNHKKTEQEVLSYLKDVEGKEVFKIENLKSNDAKRILKWLNSLKEVKK